MNGQFLSQQELDQLSAAVADAERATSGEMRLIIVQRSSRTPYAFYMSALLLSVFGLMALWTFRYNFILHAQSYYLMAAIILLAVTAGWILARFHFIQRLFTFDMSEQVLTRAELEFYREGLSATSGQTGILIFLSLFEHQAVVLGDTAIDAKLKPEVWRDVINKVLEGGRSKQWHKNLSEAIAMCGDILQKHFPIKPGDKNELPNHVIVKS